MAKVPQFHCSGDKELANAVAEGHRWWVLSEDTPVEVQLLISEYRNSEQNTAQAIRDFPVALGKSPFESSGLRTSPGAST